MLGGILLDTGIISDETNFTLLQLSDISITNSIIDYRNEVDRKIEPYLKSLDAP